MLINNFERINFRYPGEMEHEEFEVDAVYCTGGTWLYGASVVDFFMYTTKKLTITLLHREGIENEAFAKEILHYIQYLVDNLRDVNVSNISIEEALKDFSFEL